MHVSVYQTNLVKRVTNFSHYTYNSTDVNTYLLETLLFSVIIDKYQKIAIIRRK